MSFGQKETRVFVKSSLIGYNCHKRFLTIPSYLIIIYHKAGKMQVMDKAHF